MTERKPFLLRIDAGLYAALARWADDETRSLNGQIEALLHRAAEADGRFPASASRRPAEHGHPRQPRAASQEPGRQPHGRGRVPRRPSTPASRPKAGRSGPEAAAATPSRTGTVHVPRNLRRRNPRHCGLRSLSPRPRARLRGSPTTTGTRWRIE